MEVENININTDDYVNYEEHVTHGTYVKHCMQVSKI